MVDKGENLNILVTGGAGYIGSVLTQMLLNKNHHVRVLDSLMYGGESLLPVWSHKNFEFMHGDVCSEEDSDKAARDMDCVVHLASIVGDPACKRKPDLARQINLDGSINMLQQAKKNRVRKFVFSSTCSNYGKMADPEQPLDENSPISPLSLYAETKVAFEKIILDPAQAQGICTTSLRFATVYGVSPRMRFDLTVNEFTLEIVKNKYLKVYGEQFWRPYAHLRDICQAIMLVIDAPDEVVCNNMFNVGASDQNFQKQQLIEKILPYQEDALIDYVNITEDPRDYRVSFEKIARLLGFKNDYVVEDGIREVVNLIASNPSFDFSREAYRN